MIEVVARTGVPIQRAINLVSVLSLFGIGMVLLGWTHRPAYCALLMATPAIVVLGRIGTPDAFRLCWFCRRPGPWSDSEYLPVFCFC